MRKNKHSIKSLCILLAWNLHRDKCLSRERQREETFRGGISMTTRRDSIFRSICPFLRHHSVRRFNPFERRDDWILKDFSYQPEQEHRNVISLMRQPWAYCLVFCGNLRAKNAYNAWNRQSLLFALCQRSSRSIRQRGSSPFHIHIYIYIYIYIYISPRYTGRIKADTFASDPLFPLGAKKVRGRDVWLLGIPGGKKPT